MDNDKVEINWDEEKKASGVSEMLKKLVATGLSSPFLSEEQLKVYLQGLNLPREVVLQVLKTAQKSKQEMVQRVGNEFSKVLQKIDIVKEFKSVLREHKISIQADIEFVAKEKPATADEDITPKS